jgi:hypothetical protein
VPVYGRVNARPRDPGIEQTPLIDNDGGAFHFRSGPGATRTRDLLLRRQALYPTELRTLTIAGKIVERIGPASVLFFVPQEPVFSVSTRKPVPAPLVTDSLPASIFEPGAPP